MKEEGGVGREKKDGVDSGWKGIEGWRERGVKRRGREI